jgi:hypothetical protein
VTQRQQLLARERRWALATALAAFAAVLFVLAAIIVATQGVGQGDGESEVLRHVQAHRSAELISSILQAIGIGLLAVPLYYLFRAAQARSDRVRGNLVGVVIAGPLFLAVSAILSGVSSLDAAADFVTNQVPHLAAQGIALGSDRADEIAQEALDDASLRVLAAGFGLGGQLGFIFAMVYTCLHAMRVGLLTRFWGSLGIALGAVSFLFFQFAMLWFVYLGVLLLLRGSQPPAWGTGEAVPWPTPGERMSADLAEEQRGKEEQQEPAEQPALGAGGEEQGPRREA